MTKAVVTIHITNCQQLEGWTVFLTNTKPTNVQLASTAGLKVHSVSFWLFCPHPAHSHHLQSVTRLVSGMMMALHDFWNHKILINRKIIVRIYFIEEGCGNSPYMPASSRWKIVTECWAKRELENQSKGNRIFWSTNGHVVKALFLLLISPNPGSGFHNSIFFLNESLRCFCFSPFCIVISRFGTLLVFREWTVDRMVQMKNPNAMVHETEQNSDEN